MRHSAHLCLYCAREGFGGLEAEFESVKLFSMRLFVAFLQSHNAVLVFLLLVLMVKTSTDDMKCSKFFFLLF